MDTSALSHAGSFSTPTEGRGDSSHEVGPGEATTNIHASLISPGVLEALHHVPFHGNGVAPLSRRVLAGPSVHPEVKKHIVSHEIREVSAARRSYCGPHVHDCDEVNILLSLTGLSYEIRLGDEIYIIAAPATIHIPAGLVHSANVIEGSGFYIAMLDTDDYLASVRPVPAAPPVHAAFGASSPVGP